MEARFRSRLNAWLGPIPVPGRRDLRIFGFSAGSALALMFGLIFPWFAGRDLPAWPFLAAAALMTLATFAPMVLAPLHFVWMRVGRLVGALLAPVVAAVIYFAVITPAGWLRRTLGSDPMARRLDQAATTYRIPSTRSPREKMERPY